MNKQYQVIIIGAGAAGLMCAITAGKRGRKVLIIDHANKVGKKILMSGGGRCNFTNYYISADNYLSHNPHFCKSALSRYDQWQFIALVEQYGIDYYEKTLGQLFCQQSSKQIRDLLLDQCQQYGVDIKLNCKVTDIVPNTPEFNVVCAAETFECDSLVIATGGLSIPTMGASDFGYKIAKKFGHSIYPTRPALTPLTFKPQWLDKTKSLTGSAIHVAVTCHQQSFKEAFLFTHKGLSGPAILQISSYWQPGDPLYINLMPQQDAMQWLLSQQDAFAEKQLKTLLSTKFSKAFAEFICIETNLTKKIKQLNQNDYNKLAMFLSKWCLYPSGYEGYRVAEVTLGGINTDEISSKTFESSKQKNLYFIGEVLDVTGHLGGYNFQWAWASGHAAGQFV